MLELGSIDWETYSEAGHVWNEETRKWVTPKGARKKGLSVVGTTAYAQHPSTEVLTLSYRHPGESVKHRWRPGMPLPQDLFDRLAAGAVYKAHNFFFEMSIWEECATVKYGWPSILPWRYQFRCTMAAARVNSFPGALGILSEVLQLPTPKDADGTRLLDKYSVPRNVTKADPRWRIRPTDPGEEIDGEKLYGYCDTDLDAEEGAYGRMLPMSPDELLFWWIDQEINWRGMAIDRQGVRDCIVILEAVFEKYVAECKALTGFAPSQGQALLGWIAARGLRLPDMKAATLAAALGPTFTYELTLGEDDGEDLGNYGDNGPPIVTAAEMPANVRRAIELRALTASASVKKLYAMELRASRDDRLTNLIIHHGARTGRPTGDSVQPLNLPRAGPDLTWCDQPSCFRPFAYTHAYCPWCAAPANKSWKTKWSGRPKGLPETVPSAVDFVLEVMSQRRLDLVEWYFGDALACIAGCIRGLFVAGPGMEIICSDYAAIETVVTAALAGEQWRLDVIASGVDIYLASASKITGLSVEEYEAYRLQNGEHHPHRQKIGKVNELACLGPQTQVLTSRGYLALVDVRLSDLLWDGIEWVAHLGVVAKGERAVIKLDGVEMTPDHQIICGGSWLEARLPASSPSILSQALATGSENLPWSAPSEKPTCGYGALAAPPNTASHTPIYEKGPRRDAAPAPENRRAGLGKTFLPMRTSCPTTRTGVASSTASAHASRDVTLRARISRGMQIMAGAAFGFMSLGPAGKRESGNFSPISSLWKDGTFPRSNSTASRPTATMSRETCGLSPRPAIGKLAALSEIFKSSSTTTKAVYDIAHAGARNRFTIRTNSGHMIVHNCGFGGWIGASKAFGSTEEDAVIKGQILAWRKASPRIVEMWGGQFRGAPWDANSRQEYFGFEGMAIQAILHPGVIFAYAGIEFQVRPHPAGWPALFVRLLPTTDEPGRELTYHKPALHQSTRPYARPGEYSITYWTWNTNTKYGPRGWTPMSTFGGRLTENIVQATAHDIQRFGIKALRAAGYHTVLHVYDENAAEVPAGTGSIEHFERIMSTMPPRMATWPIKAAGGWRGRRYRKG